MKTKVWLLTKCMVVVMATTLAFGVSSPASGAEKTYLFKWNNYQAPETHYEVANSAECIKKLEEVSDGRMKFEQYIGGALLSGKETLEGLGVGVADIANYYQPYGVGLNQLFDIAGLPAIWIDSGNMIRAESSMEMIAWWDEILKPLNIKMLGLYACGEGWLFSKGKPIKVPSDIKGRVLRSYASFAPAVAAQGGTTVQLGTGELYEAIMRGVADGVLTNPNAALDNLWCEVAPFGLMYPFNFIEACTLMNLDSWNSLTDKDKDLLQRTVMEQHKDFASKLISNIKPGQKTYVGLQKYATLYNPTPEENALWWKFCEPVRDDFRQKLPDTGKQQFDKYLDIAKKYK